MCRCIFFVLLALAVFSVFAKQYDEESYNSGWRINADNDLLTGQTTDRDYTGGFTLSGRRAQEYPASIDSWRAGINQLTTFPGFYQSSDTMLFHSQQYGFTLFTPDDIESVTPVHDDRPYAGLFFMSNSEFTVIPEKNIAYVSRLTVGFLGFER